MREDVEQILNINKSIAVQILGTFRTRTPDAQDREQVLDVHSTVARDVTA